MAAEVYGKGASSPPGEQEREKEREREREREREKGIPV
jgi:hypothetical protein